MIGKNIDNFLKEFTKETRFNSIYKGLKGALKNYGRSNSSLWVNTLAYFSILSLVPLLAIAFSLGRWFGIEGYLRSLLEENSPLTKESINILLLATQSLLNNTRNGILAGIGFGSLGYIVLSMFTIIEKAMNNIWHVKISRTFTRKFSDYLTVITVFPITILSMNILTSNNRLFKLPEYINVFAPYIGLWAFFFVFYKIMPNTKVRGVPALISSFIVSFLFNQSNLVFIKIQFLINAYNAIYGSFSVILIFLIWLRIIWFLILLGSHLSYVLQNSELLIEIDGTKYLNFNSKFHLVLLVTGLFIRNFNHNHEPLSAKAISRILKIPLEIIIDTLFALKENSIIFELSEEDDFEKIYKLGVNIDQMKIEHLYNIFANFGKNYHLNNNFASIHHQITLREFSEDIEKYF